MNDSFSSEPYRSPIDVGDQTPAKSAIARTLIWVGAFVVVAAILVYQRMSATEETLPRVLPSPYYLQDFGGERTYTVQVPAEETEFKIETDAQELP